MALKTKSDSLYGSSLKYTLSPDKFNTKVEEPTVEESETKYTILTVAKGIALTAFIIVSLIASEIKELFQKGRA